MRRVLFLAYHLPPIGGAGVQHWLPGPQPRPASGEARSADAKDARSAWPKEKLERASECPVCASGDRIELHADLEDCSPAAPATWTLYRCCDCGSGYLDPRPAPEWIGQAYDSGYYTHAEAFLQAAPQSNGTQLKRALRNGYLNSRFGYSFLPTSRLGPVAMRVFALRRAHAGQWIRQLARPPGTPSLLDVGCGNGAFLLQMKGTGWSLRGIDPDPEAVARAREAGIPADEGFLADRRYPANDFDAITLSHVAEHAHEPVELLRECHRILRPGGVLWIATPNLASTGYRLFGRHWRSLDPPRHLVLFSPKALKQALERIGFEPLERSPACTASWSFGASAAVSKRLDPNRDVPPLPRRLWWRARLADLGTLLRPDSGEELVLLVRKPSRSLAVTR
jgi:SAM-dependent methyltransferase